MASDVQLSVELIPGDVKQAAAQLQAEIESVFNSSVDEKLQVSFARLQQSMREAYRTAESMKQEMTTLEGTTVQSDAFIKLNKDIHDTEANLIKLNDRMAKFIAIGGKEDSRTFKSMQYDAKDLESRLKALRGYMRDLVESGQHRTAGVDTARYQQLAEKLERVNNQMRIYSMRAREMINKSNGPKQDTISKWERLRNVVNKAANAMRRFAGSSKGVSGGFFKTFSGMFTGLNKGLSSFTKGLNKGFWTVLKYTLGLRSLFIVTNKMRNALKDGIKNLVQYSETFNKSVSNMLSSFNYVKNSLATAFEPILTMIEPMIVHLVDTVAEAFGKISHFLSAMMGRSYYYKAKKVYQDYAESLRSESDKTKDTVEELQRTISGFDDVEILKEPKDTGSGSGDGDSNKEITPADMFETLPVEQRFKDLADKIKEAWAKGDFTEIGRILGTKLRDALDSIDWEPIKKQAEKTARVVATFLNGFFETPGLFESIGRTLAEGVNTGLTFGNTFLETIHTDSIGKAITTAISNFFKNIDWSLLGETISHAFARLFDFIRGLIEGIDWSNLPYAIVQGIKDFFTGFDWQSFFQSLGALLGAAIKAGIEFAISTVHLFAMLIEWIGKEFKERIDAFREEGMPLGLAIIAGVLQGIKDALIAIGTWIYEHILKPFIDGFKEAFGIASPSKVMMEYGGYIIEGLLQGIIGALTAIGTWIKEHIFQPFIDGFKKVFGINSPSTVMEEQGGYIIDGMLNGIKNKLADIKEWVKEHIFSKFKGALETAFDIKNKIANKLKDVGESISEGIKKGTDGKLVTIANVFSSLPSLISRMLSSDNFISIGSNIVSGIQSGITSGWNWLTQTASNLATSIFTSAKNALGIHSPSRVFRDEVGKMITAGLALGIENGESDVLDTMSDLSDYLFSAVPKEIKLPSIVGGEVIPYDVELSSKSNINNIMDTLNNLIEMLEYNQDNQFTIEELEQVIRAIVQEYMNIEFYLGDEQVARHANNGNAILNRRFNPVLT